MMNAGRQGSGWDHFRNLVSLTAVMLALMLVSPPGSAQDADSKTIVFVCQHGVVNSQMAAAYFNKVARERGLPFTAVSRGIESTYKSVPTRIEDGLALDGLAPSNAPRAFTADEAGKARQVLAFDTIPADRRGGASVTYWTGIPIGINEYEATRDQIIQRIDALLPTLANEAAK